MGLWMDILFQTTQEQFPFAALNIMMPFLMIIAAIGFMFGSGGIVFSSDGKVDVKVNTIS